MQQRRLTRAVRQKTGAEFRSGSELNGWIYLDGVKLLRVTLPKVKGTDIDRGTARSIRDQLRLSDADFEGLYDCPFGSAQFRIHLERVARGEAQGRGRALAAHRWRC
jgi:hypothetical protein